MEPTIDFKMPWFKRKLYLSTKPYFMIKNREAGEKDLEALAHSEEIEGAWLFNSDDSSWYNIGYKTFTEESGLTIGVKTYTPDVSRMGSTTHYHIHPQSIEKKFYNELIAERNAKGLTIKESDIRRFVAINMVLPSTTDILCYLKFLEFNIGCAVDFRIVSPYGVTRVDYDCIPSIGAIERYRKARGDKIRMNIVLRSCQDTKSAVLSTLDKINQEMKEVFRIAIDYRGRCNQ